MPERTKEVHPPRGWQRLMWRTPIWLYRMHLGWLLGSRFMRLHHAGRRSGRPRQVVVEVVKHDPDTDTFYAASGFGKGSDWYQNVIAQPDVKIQVGGKMMAVRAVPLTPEQSGSMMVDYAHRYPRSARGLMWLIGYKVSGEDSDYFAAGRDLVPFVAFRRRE